MMNRTVTHSIFIFFIFLTRRWCFGFRADGSVSSHHLSIFVSLAFSFCPRYLSWPYSHFLLFSKFRNFSSYLCSTILPLCQTFCSFLYHIRFGKMSSSSPSKLTSFSSFSFPTQIPQILILLALQYLLTLFFPAVYAFLFLAALLVTFPRSWTISPQPPLDGSAPLSLSLADHLKDVKLGRWTAQPGRMESGEEGGVVCFVLGASSNQFVCPVLFFALLSSMLLGL